MFWNGSTAIEGRSGCSRASETRSRTTVLLCGVTLARGANADLERVDPDRFGDVLEHRRAEIPDRKIEPRFYLPIGIFRQTDRPRLGDAFKPRGDIHSVAHEITVALLDDIAEMNADAKIDALIGRQAGIALGHAVLHFYRATHSLDDAAEFDQSTVAGPLDDAPVMHGDGWIDQNRKVAKNDAAHAVPLLSAETTTATHHYSRNPAVRLLQRRHYQQQSRSS